MYVLLDAGLRRKDGMQGGWLDQVVCRRHIHQQ